MKKLILAAAALIMTLASCSKKSETVSADSILLYAGDGFVALNTPKYYKITKDGVMEDTLVQMNNEDTFDIPVPAEKTVLAKQLLDKVTTGMLAENNKKYNSGHMADAAYNTITATVDGKTYQWIITDDVESLPKHVRGFGEALRDATVQLEQ